MDPKHEPIWRQARPLLGVRSNDVHTEYCYHFARALCSLHAEADADVVLPAILLHDIGWSTVPPDRILESFGPRTKYPELRRRHEVEGARLARGILNAVAHPAAQTEAIVRIIDGHDTRDQALSLEDGLVKDADKLWRYTPFGLETVREWFGHSVGEQFALLEEWSRTRFFVDAARHMAIGLLTGLRAEAEVRRG